MTIIPGSTTARVVFTRPDTATSCSYALTTTDFANESDAGDTSTATGKLEHIFNLTGLTPATTYKMRITCTDGNSPPAAYFARRFDVLTTN